MVGQSGYRNEREERSLSDTKSFEPNPSDGEALYGVEQEAGTNSAGPERRPLSRKGMKS
jgi:hypothetical protein